MRDGRVLMGTVRNLIQKADRIEVENIASKASEVRG